MKKILFTLLALAFAIGLTLPAALPALAAGITGAIWTTNSTGTVVNQNIYGDKGDVYLNGGPTHSGAPGLPNGYYYVQVTNPNGDTVLGKSIAAVAQVSGGNFFQLYQLVDILYTSSSGFTIKGYDDTTNQGGEYKVWVSQNSAFPANESKTDNFKVKEEDGGGEQASGHRSAPVHRRPTITPHPTPNVPRGGSVFAQINRAVRQPSGRAL